jgi:CBS domain-containing protein
MRIKELMSKPVITCPDSGTLDHAARLMWEFDCGIIPVVDAEGRLTGVVTDRDICMAAYTQGRPLRDIAVTIAMAKRVIAVHGDEIVETAELLMHDNQIRRVPVIDDDRRPIGIVSINDLARLAVRSKRSGVDRELVRTLAAICEPRPHATPDGEVRTPAPALVV